MEWGPQSLLVIGARFAQFIYGWSVMLLWKSIAVGFIVAIALVPLTMRVLRAGSMLDAPNSRSSHKVVTPRGAGIAQVPAMTVAFLAAGPVPLAAWVSVLGFSAIGVADDIRSLGARRRLVLQAVVATVAVYLLVTSVARSLPLSVVLCIAASGMLIAIVNATNFMDGINGISVVHGVIFGSAYVVVFWSLDLREWMLVSGALVGVSLSLFPWNWGSAARVFLGDSGSYLLGATAGILGVAAWLVGSDLIVALAPLAIYLTDTGATLVRRAWRREPLMTGHRSHTYQRLANGRWSHTRTASVVAIFSVGSGAIGLLVLFEVVPTAVAMLMLAVVSSAYLLLPRLVDRWTRQVPPRDAESEST